MILPTDNGSPADGVILAHDLTRTYRIGNTPVHALRQVNLTARRGEMISIMGASGSGKSTLLNLLGCLDSPTSGSLCLAGRETRGLSRDEQARIRNQLIGIVFQGFNLLTRTSAVENVELPLLYRRNGRAADSRRAATDMLRRVGLGERLAHDSTELSGGEQQRVAIARAMISQPEILLADEPTGNLDSKTSIEVMGLFQELNEQGITILIVTHEDEIAQYTNRIIELRDGQIVSDRPVEEEAIR